MIARAHRPAAAGAVAALAAGILSAALLAGCSRQAAPPVAERADVDREGTTAVAVPPAEPVPSGPPWFVDVTAPAGIGFLHRSGDSTEKPFPSANGSGLASLDYDLDGRHDLVFVTGVPFPIDRDAAPFGNRIYRNRGAWRFDDVTEAVGLRHGGYVHGAAVGDVDSDGFPDLFLSGYGADVLFLNQGDGTFRALGPEAGLDDGGWSSSAAFLDADGDALLDLYVCRYGTWTPETAVYCGDKSRGIRVFCSPLTVEPEPDVFRRNAGDGTFPNVAAAIGLDGRPGRGLGVIAAHLDGDAFIDLYVANDMNANSLWTGSAEGRFVDRSDLSGTAYDHEGRVKSSMGVDVADTGNRGQPDIMVTDFQGEANLFFAGSTDGIFREVGESSGAGAPSLTYVSWGVQFGDYDLDGWEDVIVTNGHVGDDRQKNVEAVELRQLPLFLRNDHGHFTAPPRAELGPYFTEPHQGRGVTAVDLDNDGDLDLAFNHRDEMATVLRNDRGRPGSSRRTIVLRLVGTLGNRDAVGAVVSLEEGGRTRAMQVTGGGGYQSSRDRRIVFALDDDAPAPRIAVRWPGGRVTELEGLEPEGAWLVVEPDGPEAAPRIRREVPPS